MLWPASSIFHTRQSTKHKINMRTAFGSASRPASNLTRYWIIYILHLFVILLINCVLSFYSLVEVDLPIKIFTISAFIPSPIYLMESLMTRAKFVEIFSEIKSVDASLMSSGQKHVTQVTKGNLLKIIFVFIAFVIQICVICVQFFIYGSFSVQVYERKHN